LFNSAAMSHEPKPPKTGDHYAALGVSNTATDAEIKRSYHALARLHHPDKKAPGEADNAAEFRQVNEAFEVLRDDTQRAKYDRSYAKLSREWVQYRVDVMDHQRDPAAWKRKKAAKRPAAGRSRPSNPWAGRADDDEDDDANYGYDYGHRYGFGSFFGFASGFGSGPSDEWEDESEEDDMYEYFEHMEQAAERARAREEAQAEIRKQKAEAMRARVGRDAANKRVIERQVQAAAEDDKKIDGIRIFDPSVGLLKAKQWVEGIQRYLAGEMDAGRMFAFYACEAIELGWEKKKGRATCHFCDARVQEYSWRCPSGGAVACRACRKKIQESSLEKPFAYINTGAGAKKGKGKKGTTRNTKAPRPAAEVESDLEDEGGEEAELDTSDGAEERAAQEAEVQAKEAEEAQKRKKSEKKARAKAAKAAREQQAKEKVAKEEEETRKEAEARSARVKELVERAAMEKERRNNATREKEEKKADEKRTRKKLAAEKKAQEKFKEREALRQAEEKEAHEMQRREAILAQGREALQAKRREEEAARFAEERALRETEAQAALLAIQEAARLAEEHAVREAEERAIREAEERAIREAEERVIREAEEHAAREAEARAIREEDDRAARDTEARAFHEAKVRAARQKADQMREAELRTVREQAARITPKVPTTKHVAPKKPTKKSIRPPLICYTCNKEGHIARYCSSQCVVPKGQANEVQNLSTDTDIPPSDIKEASIHQNSLEPTKKGTQKAQRLRKRNLHVTTVNGAIRKTDSAPVIPAQSTRSASPAVSQEPVESTKKAKKKPTRKPRTTGGVTLEPAVVIAPVQADEHAFTPRIQNAAGPPKKAKKKPEGSSRPTFSDAFQEASTTQHPQPLMEAVKMSLRPAKPRAPPVCYKCREKGHIARNCPVGLAA
jgi:curved DNA-binding protein CbpA